jgi:hypothetical protein
MLQSDGRGNFNEWNDGHPTSPNSALSGYDYAEGLIWAANGHWDQHPDLAIPASTGAIVPGLPKRIHLLLTGVYFHRDDNLRVFNNNINPSQYNVNPDSVINIYLTEVALDQSTGLPAVPSRSGGVARQVTYCANAPATGLWTALLSPWSAYVTHGAQPWQFASVLNHEIGHLLGLQHSFYGFQCADTPANSNCWNLNEPPGPNCDSPSEVSNNLMDYNAAQVALSPCQLSTIHQNLNSCLRKYVHSCSNCLPTVINFTVEEGYNVAFNYKIVILDGRSSFAESWFTISIDEIDMQYQPIAGTHFEQTHWRQMGIEDLNALYYFRPSGWYRIQVNGGNCGYPSAVQTYYINLYSPPQEENHRGVKVSGVHSTISTEAEPWLVYPNPAHESARLQGLPSGAQVWLLDTQGRVIRRFKPENGHGLRQINLQNIPVGTYLLKVEGAETFFPPQRLVIQ